MTCIGADQGLVGRISLRGDLQAAEERFFGTAKGLAAIRTSSRFRKYFEVLRSNASKSVSRTFSTSNFRLGLIPASPPATRHTYPGCSESGASVFAPGAPVNIFQRDASPAIKPPHGRAIRQPRRARSSNRQEKSRKEAARKPHFRAAATAHLSP
jgi:hypothetical protein